MRLAAIGLFAVGVVVASFFAGWAQQSARPRATPPAHRQTPAGSPAPASNAPVAEPAPSQTVTGGRLHGVATSGKIPLPGVTVTAQNTLTGKRYSTTSDISGSWSLNIPQNGRYVIRTQFAAFAVGSQEAVLNAASHDQAVNFDLMLGSRAQEQQAREAAQDRAGADSAAAQAIQQLAGNGAQSLSLVSALAADTETQAGN